jgi:hypothetical protein
LEEKATYRFDSTTGIVIKTYHGSITVSDIHNSWLHAFSHGSFPLQNTGFVLDYREAVLDMNIREHAAIADFFKDHLAYFGNKKIAVVTENPDDIVIPVLVREKDSGYESRPFSTMEGAIQWVLTGIY